MESLNLKLFKFLFILFLTLPVVAHAQLREDIIFYESVLNSINQSTGASKPQTCGTLVTEIKKCSELFHLFERDKSTGLFFGMISDSPWDTCKKYISSSKDISLSELEKILAHNKKTSLGMRSDYFSSRVDECFLGNRKIKKEDADTQKKMIVSMGYDYLNRLKKSTSHLSEEVKRLNAIMGEPVETGLPCANFTMPDDLKICQDIKTHKCQSKNELSLYTNSLYENAIEPMAALKKAHSELSLKFSKTRTLKKTENQKVLNDLTNKMKSIESQFPILRGKALSSFISKETDGGKLPALNKLESAVKNQLQENRQNILKKLNENIDMNNCIVHGDEGYCKKFSEHFERIPSHEDVFFFDKDQPTNRQKNLAATEIYNSNQCLDNFRGLKSEFNSFAADFSINVGLTLFTGGTGLLARAGGHGVKAALAGHKAMLVADAAFLGTGVDEAISHCSKELNKLESVNVSSNSSSSSSLICPLPLSSPEHVLVANYQGCITGAMMASLNVLPFVPAVATKYLSRVKNKIGSNKSGSVVDDLLHFNAPKKVFDSHDLRSTGLILLPGKTQEATSLFKRDGVYVYIIDDKGKMVISHRTPDLSAGIKEGDQFLGTHRGLYNKMSETGSTVVTAAGEIRVIGGVPVKVSPRAGSFHNTAEDIFISMRKTASPEEIKSIDSFLDFYSKIPAKDKSDPMMVEMLVEDFMEAHPGAEVVYNKMKQHLQELTDKRLGIAKEAMESRGLLPKEIETKFVRDVAGDAHVEGKAAAIAEINCSKSNSCANQLETYQKVARQFLAKYKSADKIEDALVLKMKAKEFEGASKRDQVFRFLNQRSPLLFKEGPIEFIQSSNPAGAGLTAEDVFKYMREWSEQF